MKKKLIEIDLLIQNGLLLTYNQKPRIGSVAIQDNKIMEIGENATLERKYNWKNLLDATGKIVMPGFVNTHTHAAMSYFKGLADDLPLMDWLTNFIWPAEKHFLTAEFVYDAVLHGCAEMIRHGITCFNDMYFFGDEAAQAAQKVGIRAVLGEGVLDYPAVKYQNADEIFAYISEMHAKYKDHGLIDFAVAPHAIYTCGKTNLIKAKELAAKLGILLHLHLSETRQEVEDCLKEHSVRPTEYLNQLGIFEQPVVAAHAIWLSREEHDILAEKNVSIAINTSSNLKLASGFDSFAYYLKEGINLSLGTDGVASNNNLSMLQEISLTAKLQKALNNDPTILPARQMIEIATLGGAKALQKQNSIGSLQEGRLADLITIDINSLEALPIYDPFSHLVYSLSSEHIKDVVINGNIVMKDRQLQFVEEAELLAKARYHQQKITEFVAK
ncbi:MAG: amidohydrolase [Candidatus Cloacimonetes bacterium]|nr:amidohydrolase [Candidatus Cloacimonadota bacterium]MCF7812975.1 amidohydrolase [Candidatus Cloacimonadota bacterium]MCF7867293.1 amidohydrolase [Candidatus Cloacimonadota bacterium]MCF7882737.1 amidohydrolase [Candidatus Cloacimonadota bacterium]